MSVITAGRAGRVPPSPARANKKNKTLDSESQAASGAETVHSVAAFRRWRKSMFCACSSQEAKLWMSSPGLLHTPPDVFFPLAGPAVCPLTVVTHCQDW